MFRAPDEGPYQIQVLAPGFAAETIDVSSQAEITVRLRLATASETVVVSATRTPVPSQAAGADVDTLTAGQLTTMQPTAASDAIRFLPGAIVNDAGQRGGLTSLFVRGGESRYNKVIVDGVTINEPGGTFDFGTLPLDQADRMEFVRGAQSTLYGSDAMTSVVQVWTRAGSYAQCRNLLLAPTAAISQPPRIRFAGRGSRPLRLQPVRQRIQHQRRRHQQLVLGFARGRECGSCAQRSDLSSRSLSSFQQPYRRSPASGISTAPPLQPPDPNDWSQLNDLLGSAELAVTAPSGWQHRLTGFDYVYRYNELNLNGRSGRVFDFPSHEVDHINRAGFEYQGDYSERSWAHTTFGFRVENENGFVGNLAYGSQTHGQRLSNDVYAQQQVTWRSLTAIVGARFVHNSAFGNIGLPRVALTWQALRGERDLFRNAPAFFLCHRLQRTAAGRNV